MIHNNSISETEIICTLQEVSTEYFHIEDKAEYAQKLIKLGRNIALRDKKNNLLSYILYYDNSESMFISMVWTKESEQGNGYAKSLIIDLINNTSKDISLEVHKENPAIHLYKKVGFTVSGLKNDNFLMTYMRTKP